MKRIHPSPRRLWDSDTFDTRQLPQQLTFWCKCKTFDPLWLKDANVQQPWLIIFNGRYLLVILVCFILCYGWTLHFNGCWWSIDRSTRRCGFSNHFSFSFCDRSFVFDWQTRSMCWWFWSHSLTTHLLQSLNFNKRKQLLDFSRQSNVFSWSKARRVGTLRQSARSLQVTGVNSIYKLSWSSLLCVLVVNLEKGGGRKLLLSEQLQHKAKSRSSTPSIRQQTAATNVWISQDGPTFSVGQPTQTSKGASPVRHDV